MFVCALTAALCSGMATSGFMEFLQEHTSCRQHTVAMLGMLFFVFGFASFMYVPLKIRWLLSPKFPNDEFLETLFVPMGFLEARALSSRGSAGSYLGFITSGVLRLSGAKRDTAYRYYAMGRNFTPEQAHALLDRYHAYWTTDFEKKRLFLWQIGVIYYFGYYFTDPRYTVMMSDIRHFQRENELFDLLASWYRLPEDEIPALFELVCRMYGYGGYYRDRQADSQNYDSYFQRSYDDDPWSGGQDPFVQINAPSRSEIRKACKLFKIGRDTDFAEARKIYRSLMLKNHPDRAVAEGLSPEEIRQRTEKSQEIQAAWNVIRYMYSQKERQG